MNYELVISLCITNFVTFSKNETVRLPLKRLNISTLIDSTLFSSETRRSSTKTENFLEAPWAPIFTNFKG